MLEFRLQKITYAIIRQLQQRQHEVKSDLYRKATKIKPSEYLISKFKANIIQYLIQTHLKDLSHFALTKIKQFSKHKHKLTQPFKQTSKYSDQSLTKNSTSHKQQQPHRIQLKNFSTQTQAPQGRQTSTQTQEISQKTIEATLKNNSRTFAAKTINLHQKFAQMRVKIQVLNKIKSATMNRHISRLKVSKKQSISQSLEFIQENKQKYQQFSEIIQQLQDELQLKTIEYEQLSKKYNIVISNPSARQKSTTRQQSKSVVSEGQKTDNASSSGMNKSMVLKCTEITYIEDETASPPRTPRNQNFIKN